MRLTSLLTVLFLALTFLMLSAQTQTDPRIPGSDSVRMWRRAEIRVVPLDLVASQRAELQSLSARVSQAEMDAARLSADRVVREQLSQQIQLMKELLNYAERARSDEGKSPMALEVQNHLNSIEGQVMCQSCHAGVVADARFVK